MSVGKIRTLEKQLIANNGKLDAGEVDALIEQAKDRGGVNKSEKRELQALLKRNADKFEPGAQVKLEQFLGVTPSPLEPDPNAPIRCVKGRMAFMLNDDTVYFGPDGAVRGTSGVTPYTRSYDATSNGPLRIRHGSLAPPSTALDEASLRALHQSNPGQALDAAAKVFGIDVGGFEVMANSKQFYDPDAPSWNGKCHAWSWSALSNEVSKFVDAEGPEGQRGMWIGGQWMSRADLGNWMMAVSDIIAIADPKSLDDCTVTPEDLLKGTVQFLCNNGGGIVLDIHNDKAKGTEEVWNQPFIGSDFVTQSLTGPAADALLAQAKADGVTEAVGFKHVKVAGHYGVEVSDSYEGDPSLSSQSWNVYAAVDASGKMLKAYMADDPKLSSIPQLPTRSTDDLPDYFWKPKQAALTDVLAGRTNWSVENDDHGKEFKFFVNYVLQKGVPGPVRAAFEAELAALPPGPVDLVRAADLERRFPNVANAYSPEQWERTFGSRGLGAKLFGAAW